MEQNKLQKMNKPTSNGSKTDYDKAVQYIAKLLGVKNLSLEDRKFVVIWLYNNVVGIGVEELIKAAEMALKGTISANLETYGTLSPKFFAELIRRYKEWKIEDNKIQKMKAPLLPEPKKDQKEVDKIMYDELLYVFNVYKSHGLDAIKQNNEVTMPLAAYSVLFDWAWKHGLVRYGEETLEAIRKEALEYLNAQSEYEKSFANNMIDLRQIIDKYSQLEGKSIFKSACKRIYLRRFFNDIIEIDESIENVIKL